MAEGFVKPSDCTCPYPNLINRNMTGHAPDCPAHKRIESEWLRQRPTDLTLASLEDALRVLKHHKPNDRSEKDRYWAIVITDMEKAIAVFKTYIALQ